MSDCEIAQWAPTLYIIIGATVAMLGMFLGAYVEFMRPKNKEGGVRVKKGERIPIRGPSSQNYHDYLTEQIRQENEIKEALSTFKIALDEQFKVSVLVRWLNKIAKRLGL